MPTGEPDFILYAQHGWADNHQAIAALAKSVAADRFRSAQFVYLPGLSHGISRNHQSVATAIRRFWEQREVLPTLDAEIDTLIQQLQVVPGMTDAHQRDFYRARLFLEHKSGVTIRTWRNPFGVDHVFIACPKGQCLYGGFVGWVHPKNLRQVLEGIRKDCL